MMTTIFGSIKPPAILRSLRAVVLLAGPLLVPDGASAETNWINPTLGNWSISSNWSDGVPTHLAYETATIGNGGTAFINSNAYATNLDISSGSLLINNGAVFTQYSSHSRVSASVAGSATVSNSSSWTVDDLSLKGGGSLRVESGADVENQNGTIEGNSVATVTGSGSTWTNTNLLYVGGTSGAAALHISSQGLVRARALRVSSAGSVEVNNGSSTTAGLTIGGDPVASNAGAFGGLTVGNTSNGRMVVQESGVVDNSLGTIGANSGTTGSVLVHGEFSAWYNSDSVVVGLGGTGTLEVRRGGRLVSFQGIAGANAFSTGTITVSDPGSEWIATGSFFIGNSGSGLLEVLNGGVASTTGNSHLGITAGANGDVNVSGAGSTLNVGVLLNIGGDSDVARGTGSVRIADGGAVNVGSATNLYSTGKLELAGGTTFTGDLNAFGGLIRTIGDTTVANAVHLNAGGVFVDSFTPGSNSTFSGNIDGPGGLTKSGINGFTGRGTLTLAGANTYLGPTTVTAGRLLINGTNTSAVTVNAGTLGGTGVISGAVTIGNNSGNDDAIIAPGASVGTLATGDLNLNADAVFAFELDSHSGLADQIAVTGTVTLNPGALFTFTDFASCELTPGMSLILIDNDGDDPINGAFGNLTEGFMFTSGPNVYQASYLGGTGNDLVLNTPESPFLEADFDEDLDVDGDDLARWQTNFGTGATHIEGNADYDCDVDGADFLTWQRQLGSGPPVTAASAPVPEPATIVLLVLAAVGLCARQIASEKKVPATHQHMAPIINRPL